MRLDKWGHSVIAAAMVLVMGLITHDQLFVDLGDDASYLLGKATPAVVWGLTLATLFGLGELITWLRRTRGGTPGFWWAIVGVGAAFLIAWSSARGWSLVWLVEGDIEVTLDGDEYFPVVVGMWSASLAALVIRLRLRTRQVGADSDRRDESSGLLLP
jgi:hypothetical protein